MLNMERDNFFIVFFQIFGRIFRLFFFLALTFYAFFRLPSVNKLATYQFHIKDLFFLTLLVFSCIGLFKPYGMWGSSEKYYFDSEWLYLTWGIVGSVIFLVASIFLVLVYFV